MEMGGVNKNHCIVAACLAVKLNSPLRAGITGAGDLTSVLVGRVESAGLGEIVQAARIGRSEPPDQIVPVAVPLHGVLTLLLVDPPLPPLLQSNSAGLLCLLPERLGSSD